MKYFKLGYLMNSLRGNLNKVVLQKADDSEEVLNFRSEWEIWSNYCNCYVLELKPVCNPKIKDGSIDLEVGIDLRILEEQKNEKNDNN